MGKKDSNKRKRADEAETEEVDPELQAEIAAVLASRSERSPSEVTEIAKVKTNIYNKEGLENSLENIDTVDLPFEETMQICEYDISIQNENDDIEREVRNKVTFKLLGANTFYCRWLFTTILFLLSKMDAKNCMCWVSQLEDQTTIFVRT